MLYIEKIHTDLPNKEPHIGLVDLFTSKDIRKTYMHFLFSSVQKNYGHIIQQKLKNNDIILGHKHGSQGINIWTLIQRGPDSNTMYEIGAADYLYYPQRIRNLLKKLPIIINDYIEGGKTLEYPGIPENLIKTSGAFDHQHSDIDVPIFLMSTAAHYHDLPWPRTTSAPLSPRVLFLAGKPRKHRLDTLQGLQESGILEKCDWSLFTNPVDTSYCEGILDLPGVDLSHWEHIESHDFIKEHRHHLPKYLDNIKNYSEIKSLDLNFFNKYSWYISAETFINSYFVTEKTIKAFATANTPLTISKPGFNEYLESLGFMMHEGYDHLSGHERIQTIIDIIKHQKPNNKYIQHNIEILQDKEHISNIIVDNILKLKNYPV